MSEALKFTDRDALLEAFPDITLRSNLYTGDVKVYDEKQDATREKRIKTAVEVISEGNPRILKFMQ